MSTDTIIDQLKTAIAARKGSLAMLRDRIAEIIEPIPVGEILTDEAGEVCRIERVVTGASQWSNRTWEVTIHGSAAITAEGKLLAENLADSLWDGNNRHHRKTEPTVLASDVYSRRALKFSSGADTRALAIRLPSAIARYMAECAEETAQNRATEFA